MAKLGAFLEAHPEALPAIQYALSQPAPASYAQLEYHGIHAFKWIDADGEERWVRFSFRPRGRRRRALRRGGRRALGATTCRRRSASGSSASRSSSSSRSRSREEGDDPDDPTEPWPDEPRARDRRHAASRGPRPHARARRRCPRLRSHPRHGRHRAVRRSRSCGSGPTRTRCRSSAAAARGASERASPPAHPRRGDPRGRQPEDRVAANGAGPRRADHERAVGGHPQPVRPRPGGGRVRLGAHAPGRPAGTRPRARSGGGSARPASR